MENVNIQINGMPYSVPKSMTVLEAAQSVGIEIPTLCYLKDVNEIGACRMCLVEVKGARGLVTACVSPIYEGMEIFTNTPKVMESRKLTLELILSNHDKRCLSCVRSTDCELQKLCRDYGVDDVDHFKGDVIDYELDYSSPSIVRDNNKCILCRRCVGACGKVQGIGVIGPNNRGFESHIGCAFDQDLNDVACVSCGQCIVACPVGALYEKDDTDKVWAALNDSSKHVIVNTAPSIRATLGECFGLPVGTNVEGKMVAALRKLGFAKVFDTDFSADLTILEEANELFERIEKGGKLPMITSCSPGWVKFCEHYYPDFIDNLSTCKSPQQMFGAVVKTWYAEKNGLDPKDIVVVSIMPCTAKKFECGRDGQDAAGVADVDIALTTRELGRMIERAGIKFNELEDEKFDSVLGTSTGAGVIFGATGGVMEAALRTAVEKLTGETLSKLEFTEVRGTQGIKEATYSVAGLDVKVAVVSGLANARILLDKIRAGEANYHFIEVMACPGGCVNGGGQPTQSSYVRSFTDLRAKRASVLYNIDESMDLRKSHENPVALELYKEYLGEPGSHKAHEILHTHYTKRSQF